MLVLPFLIRVYNQSVKIVELGKSLVKHIVYLLQIRTLEDVIRYYFTIEHIQYR